MKGTRPLAREEDLARTLATILHDAGKAVVAGLDDGAA